MNDNNNGSVPPHDSGVERWVLAVAAPASLMVALDALVVSTALTAIERQFHASVEALEWSIDAYLLTFAVLQMTASALGDRYGRRQVFVAGLSLFAVASAACALAPAVGWLIAARAVQGVGSAMVMPLALALIGATFAPERRLRALAIYSSVTAMSGVVGPLVGGAITQGLAWPWIFWLNLPFAAAIAIVTLRRVPESFAAPVPIDIRGLVLFTGGAFGFVWGLVRGNVAGWGSVEVVTSFAAACTLTAAFIACELRVAAPMLPMRLFAERAFAAGNATMFLINATLMGTIFFLAQFFQIGLGQSPLVSGLLLLPYGLTIPVVAPRGAQLSRVAGARTTILLGTLVQGFGLLWLASIARPGMNPALLAGPMVLAAAGFAMSITVVQQSVLAAVARNDVGKASGTLSTLRQLGGAFGVALAVAAFAHFGVRSTPQGFTNGFIAATVTVAVLSFAAALAASFFPERNPLPSRRGLQRAAKEPSVPR